MLPSKRYLRQTAITNAMLGMGYDVEELGQCHGTSIVAIQAFLCGKFADFIKRANLIHRYPTSDLINKIKAVQKKCARLHLATEEEQQIVLSPEE